MHPNSDNAHNSERKTPVQNIERFLTTPSLPQKSISQSPQKYISPATQATPPLKKPVEDFSSDGNLEDSLNDREESGNESNEEFKTVHDTSKMAKNATFNDTQNSKISKEIQQIYDEYSSDLVNFESVEDKNGTMHFLKRKNSDSDRFERDEEFKEILSNENPILSITNSKQNLQSNISEAKQNINNQDLSLESKRKISEESKSNFTIHEATFQEKPLTPALEEENSEMSISKSSMPIENEKIEIIFNQNALKAFEAKKREIENAENLKKSEQNRAAKFIQINVRLFLCKRREKRIQEKIEAERILQFVKNLELFKKKIAAKKIQKVYRAFHIKKLKESEELLQKYTSHCAILIQKHYRGFNMRKKYREIIKKRIKFVELRKALLIGWKTRCIFKCKKIGNLHIDISEILQKIKIEKNKKTLNALKEQRKKKISDFITVFQILYRMGHWTKTYTRPVKKQDSTTSEKALEILAEITHTFSPTDLKKPLDPLRETLREDDLTEIAQKSPAKDEDVHSSDLNSDDLNSDDEHNNCSKYAGNVRENPIKSFMKPYSKVSYEDIPIKLAKMNTFNIPEDYVPPKKKQNPNKKPFLKRKDVYNPKKSITDSAKKPPDPPYFL